MDLLEDMVFQQYQAVHIDASFPAESMYLKRGYRIKTFAVAKERFQTGENRFRQMSVLELEDTENMMWSLQSRFIIICQKNTGGLR